jgi:hypothetical protein
MEIGPVGSVRVVSLLKPSNQESIMPSRLEVDSAGRAADDSYESSRDSSDREHEGERPAFDQESEPGSCTQWGEDSVPADSELRVNLFA